MGSPRAVVAGLGKTGHSVIRHLLARGWRVTATDTRAAPPGIAELRAMAPALRIALGGLDVGLLTDVDYVVASPGLPQSDPFFIAARSLRVPVIGDIELFARSNPRRVAGITGTNGKSTVTSLLALMGRRAGLSTRAGGNLAPPALDLLESDPADLYVLELSSYQLETTFSLHLAAATVLNVTPDHLDRYADVGSYAAAKARIFDRCETAVVNADDPVVRAMARPDRRTWSFSLRGDSGADYMLHAEGGREWLCAGAAHRGAPQRGQRAGGAGAGRCLGPGTPGDAGCTARVRGAGASRRLGGRREGRALRE
jgi:UDP-N-acetylmuramoylalanine--D-glutamate ligase